MPASDIKVSSTEIAILFADHHATMRILSLVIAYLFWLSATLCVLLLKLYGVISWDFSPGAPDMKT